MAGSSWRDRAHCRGRDSSWFFDPLEDQELEGPTLLHLGTALCQECPVRVECLDDAMIHDQPGIRGGMDQEERRRLTRFRAKNAIFFYADMSRVLGVPAAELRRASQPDLETA